MIDQLYQESSSELDAINPETNQAVEERLTDPCKLRSIHQQNADDDQESSDNRALVQDLKDYVPPFKKEEVDGTDRMNANFGMSTAIINEGVATFVDVWVSPTCLIDIKLKKTIPQEVREDWEEIMSEEQTVMVRNWDSGFSRYLSLMDTTVTHGVGISYFDDSKDMRFKVGGLEEFKFPQETEAFAGAAQIVTSKRYISVDSLYRKIDGATGETKDGWDVELVKETIKRFSRSSIDDNNYEMRQRQLKANRVWADSCIDKVALIFGLVREMDGTYSIYATTESIVDKDGRKVSNRNRVSDANDPNTERFLYRERGVFNDANQMMQIFTYGTGNKNIIHTIRGLGYAIYEAGQADNIMRCKMMDTARMQASQIFECETTEDLKNAEVVDFGMGVALPPGIRIAQGQVTKGIDNNIVSAVNNNYDVVMQHAGGMAADKNFSNPSSRRNQMEAAWSIESMTKMQAFAVNLFYASFDKLCREIVRRSFQVVQSDPVVIDMVRTMKRACIDRGVDPSAFEEIDFTRTRAYRLVGNGSKTSRLQIYGNLMQLYPSYDANGQERFVRDYTRELAGEDIANRYAPRPEDRKPHEDVAIAKLENEQLIDGSYIEPTDGENKLVHLQVHLAKMGEGADEVLQMQEGFTSAEDVNMNFVDWILDRVTLFEHIVKTLETTTVLEPLIPRLNETRQIVQQYGELMNNGIRYIEKLKRQGVDVEAMRNGQAQPTDPQNPDAGLQAQQKEIDSKIQERILMARANIQLQEQKALADITIDRMKAAAKISIDDAIAAAKINRQ